MRTFQGVFLNAFTDPTERQQIKVIQDYLRAVSGGLSRAIGAGQSPAANPVPSPVTSPGNPLPGAPIGSQTLGDTLYGQNNGSWARLPIGSAGQFLTVISGVPSWTTFSIGMLPAHASTHKSGGGDAIKLDELAATTDVTTLNASTTAHGLLRKLDGLTTTFLRGDGTWVAPTAGLSASANETITGSWLFSGGPSTIRLGATGAGDLIKIVVDAGSAFTGVGLLLDDGSGFLCQIMSAGLLSDIALVLPTVSGTLVTTASTDSLSNKTLNNSTIIKMGSTAGSGTRLRDNTTASRQLNVFLNNATGNNVIDFRSSVARTWTTPDATGTFLLRDDTATIANKTLDTSNILQGRDDRVTVAASGDTTKKLAFVASAIATGTTRNWNASDDNITVVGEVGTPIALTGRVANVADTTIYTTNHTGMYRLTGYIVVTALTLAGAVGITGTWTDPQTTHTGVDISSNINGGFGFSPSAVGQYTWGQITVYCSSGSAIKMGTSNYTGTFTYSFYGTVEAL